MSTTATTRVHAVDSPLVSREGWWWVGIFTALFLGIYYSFLWRVFRIATEDTVSDWSFALLLPLISVYYIMQRRHDLHDDDRRVYWPGLILMWLGIFGFMFGIYPLRNDMAQGYSMVLALLGLALLLTGPTWMRVLWFPIAYLALGVKLSQLIWDPLAHRLQMVAAKLATGLVGLLGLLMDIDAEVKGAQIIPSSVNEGRRDGAEALTVAEQCAGLKMLMAFAALGIAMAFLAKRPWWHRLLFVLMIVPIAVFVNACRVAVIVVLYQKVDPKYAAGDFHMMIGLLMLIPAGGLFWLLGWVLDRMVVREDEPLTARRLRRSAVPSQPAQGLSTPRILKGLAIGAGITAVLSLGGGVAYYFLNDLVLVRLGDSVMRRAAMLGAIGAVVGSAAFALVHVLQKRRQARPSKPGPLALAVAAGVLLAGAGSVQGLLWVNEIVLFKESIPTRHALSDIPQDVGRWKTIEVAGKLKPDVEKALGTKKYFTRRYEAKLPPKPDKPVRLRLHMAYYTGMADTVPHVPERCRLGAGYTSTGSRLDYIPLVPDPNAGEDAIEWIDDARAYLPTPKYVPAGAPENPDGDRNKLWLTSIPDALAGDSDGRGERQSEPAIRVPRIDIPVTVYTYAFEQPGADGQPVKKKQHVFYFFVANGQFLASAHDVRLKVANPQDKYSFYCKIEIEVENESDARRAKRAIQNFLVYKMPHILQCLPDWHEVKAGRYPEKNHQAEKDSAAETR